MFTVHAIDYCPPWYSASTREGKIPCSDANRLGPYSLWFKDGYIYGVHGRPPDKSLQQLFTSLGSSDRKGSKGCIVVPQDHLKNFIDLIFDDPAFKDHQGVKKIKDFRSRREHKNVLIFTKDEYGKTLYQNDTEEKMGSAVEIDIKLIAIDTGDPAAWSSWSSSKEAHPIYQLLKSGDVHEKVYRLVTDCTAKGPISVYQGSSTNSNAKK